MGIRLKKNEYDSILGMLATFKEGNEFEASISPTLLTSAKFKELLVYLTSTRGSCKAEPETLDIISDAYRVSIPGVDKISAYCKKGTVPSEWTSIIEKKRGAPIEFTDYDIKLKMASEVPILDQAEKEEIIASLQGEKIFRLKKRFVFTLPDKRFKIDLTAVRESVRKHNMLSFAKIQSKCEKYELEVEYIGGAFKDSKPIVQDLFRILSELLKVIQDVDILMRNSERSSVLAQYALLVKKEMGITDISQFIERQPRKFYVAVKPVTLERRHLLKDEQINITETEYTCTEKADGERMLVYVAESDNKLYMINSRMEVLSTKIECDKKWGNSLFDAEYVIQIDKSKLLLLFDAYYVKGELVADQPLLDKSAKSDRLTHVNKFAASLDINWVRAKEFRSPAKNKTIFDSAAEILSLVDSASKFGYHVDGLIFTPAKLPVGASKESDAPSFKGTWRNTLKWKPPEENTIDFLVKSRRVVGAVEGDECNIVPLKDLPMAEKRVYLYCGQRIGSVTAEEYFKTVKKQNNREQYVPMLFTPPGSMGYDMASCKLQADANGHFKCTNGDLISDNSIMEASWDGTQWIPYRIRHDKTEALRKTKSISNTANDYEIAVSIWYSILNPVTKEHITGRETLTREDVPKDDDRYYARSVERNKSATFPMMMFHNYWIKEKHLIGRMASTGGARSLVDIACGKGGDLFKWISNGYSTVLGIDLSDNNINDRTDGAYTRLYSQRNNLKPSYKYAFVKLDSTQLYDKKQIDQQSGFNKHLARILWGMEKPAEPELLKYHGMATGKFDVVSCQFALHYFFKSPETLKAALTNIQSLIKDGGYFIGTCFDGDEVAKLLKHKNRGEKLIGTKAGETIWSIEKQYDTYDTTATGQEISVYITSINQVLTEYLVSFEFLTTEMAKYGLRLLNDAECAKLGLETSSGMFDTLFDEMLEKEPKHHAVKTAAELANSKDEQTLSFLNRWFVFTTNTANTTDTKKPKKPSPKTKKKVIA